MVARRGKKNEGDAESNVTPIGKAPEAPTAPPAEQAKGGNGKGGARVGPQGNQNDGTEFVLRIEAEQAEIDAIMREAKERCSPHEEAIKEIKNVAADAGFKKRVVNKKVKKRKLERQIKAIATDLDEVDTTTFEQLGLALDQAEMRSGAPA